MKTHIVYFVQAATMKLIKIGCTSDFPKRMESMRVGSPDELILLWRSGPMGRLEAYAAENRLHRKFAAFHVRGEWFSSEPELASFVSDLISISPHDRASGNLEFVESVFRDEVQEFVPEEKERAMFRRNTKAQNFGRPKRR